MVWSDLSLERNRPICVHVCAVKSSFRIMAVCLALLWVPVSGHCQIEALTGATLFACSDDATHEGADSAPLDDHCGGDSCATVENGHYRADLQVIGANPPIGANLLLSLLIPDTSDLDLSPGDRCCATGQPPPELSVSWQFSSRAVLSPRAPSLVS
jgi:hypothetical protein